MPEGQASFNTLATDASDYDPEAFSIDGSQLRAGVNVVAVEVHQGSATSSDISFNLLLEGDPASPVSRKGLRAAKR
ncbi:MAG: hypothetical protein HQ485_05270 [Acidobacteria bacterium]|nr:hypothetical protein [Acidobacteriota bacterium]